jgi:hypothetical protein
MDNAALTQDNIEEAERYVLSALLYDDFYPAQRIAQGSFRSYNLSYQNS